MVVRVATKDSFGQFVSQNPGTAFTDNALFWLGITNDKTGQYNQAIVSFSEVFQKYPGGRGSPALYFLAQDFLKIDSKSDAIVALQKLVEEHPELLTERRAKMN